MHSIITESQTEDRALKILAELDYGILYGPDLAPDGPNPERKTYQEVVLVDRLKDAVRKINPNVPLEAQEEAIKKILRSQSQDVMVNNHEFHKLLINGVPVEFRKGNDVQHDCVWLIDFQNPTHNEFLAINQFTIIEGNNTRRPDIILFVNGLPLVLMELKNPVDEKATTKTAFNQLQTYKMQLPSLFNFNEILVASDEIEAKAGTISSDWERFMPWKTVDGKKSFKEKYSHLEILIRGMFKKEILLDLIRHFIVYETDKKTTIKKLAAYHQYNAVTNALESTINAAGKKGNRKGGVVWHTQGSGKSLSMVFYAGKLVLSNELNNPTIVVLTDRNDLDDQLFETFAKCKELLRQTPVQAESREQIKNFLKVASGGVVFTTIQKFFPETGNIYPILSDRENIIVIADEAHRSQYGFKAVMKEKQGILEQKYGFAKYLRDALPNASFIGFTGTPIEKADKSTPAIFGKYVDVYDITQAVEDGATVKILYENRLVKLELNPEEALHIDKNFEEITEGEEEQGKQQLRSKWARIEAVVGSKDRIRRVAKDVVKHFEERSNALEGKALFVCMSRRIAIELHDEIVKLKPQWYDKDDKKGHIKVIITGSASDQKEWQEHIRNKQRRKEIGERFKDPHDGLNFVIVRDMWLTGFDVPCLHTMYIDKPMQGHGLMQAIARVNRVFKDKPGGLVVDYIGIATDLKKALSQYSKTDQEQIVEQDTAVTVLLENYEILEELFVQFDYKKFFKLDQKQKLPFLIEASEHILKQEEGKERFLKFSLKIARAFALATPHPKALELRDDVGFFQAVRSILVKTTTGEGEVERKEYLDSAIRQLVSKALVSDRVVDIFAAVGLNKPNVSVLSDEFLMEVKDMPQKNLAFEALKKLLEDQIKLKWKKNIIQARTFSAMLIETIKKYQNRSIATAQVIEELIGMAKSMKEADNRGEKLNLLEDELAFYDALCDNDSAVDVLNDETLRTIAREVADTIRRNKTIDWAFRETVQAQLRILVKKTLRKYGYPPDKTPQATELVLEQAKLLCENE